MRDREIILLAEDREDDVFLIQRSLEKAGVPIPLQVVRDGVEAIEYLQAEAKFANRAEFPLPTLMLLDLKMPRVDGFEVLAWLRKQPTLKALRVIVLTSSDYIADVDRAFELGANSFLVKPMDFENLVGIGKFFKDYWLRLDKAPQISRPPENTLAPS